jgi:hypothetical protein
MSIKALKPISDKPEVSPVVETGPFDENPEAINTSAQPLSTDALLALIASMQQQLLSSQQQAAEANKKLADAILKTTEPREIIKTKEQLAREANDKIFLEQAKETERRQKDTTRRTQAQCDHIAGGLGETKDVHQRTSIVWNRTDAQVDIGVCTTCGRRFHPEDPLDEQNHDYTYWRRKGSFNKISAAGVRQFMNPLKAQHDSFLRDS